MSENYEMLINYEIDEGILIKGTQMINLHEHCIDNHLNYVKWTCNYFTRNGDVYLMWKFDWDLENGRGLEGVIIAYYYKDMNYFPVVFDLEIRKGGNEFETRLGTIKECHFARKMYFKYKIRLSAIALVDLSIFEPSEMTDVVLVVEGRKLHVNKGFLATHSDYFRAMFFSGFKEASMKEIPIEDVGYSEFAQLLATTHPIPCIPTRSTVERLLELAERFLMPSVKLQAGAFLMDDSKFSNSHLLYLADRFGLENVMDRVLVFFEKENEIKELKNAPEYPKLSNNLKALLFDRLLQL